MMLCSEQLPCVSRHGYDILFLGDAGSQVITCGAGDRGGVISWWDSLSPSSSCCVAEIRGRKATPTSMSLHHMDSGGCWWSGRQR
ncbi:MAG: hypothetical protein WDW38_004780 [Sanguina aurantia]